jgi:arylsulfatase A-like enzyme
MKRFRLLALSTLACLIASTASRAADTRPNILWIMVDDMSANLSSYGEKLIETPNVDRLAREGTKFNRAFTTAPVCSPCRSAFITGMYQTTIGSHHHRSGRGVEKVVLPSGVEPMPALFQRAGYYTCIGSGLPGANRQGKKAKANAEGGNRGLGKTDYNFDWDEEIYNSNDWAGRKPGQPFFMQVQLGGGKLRGGSDANAQQLAARAKAELGSATDPEKVTLPPYYPRDPVLLRDWAAYLDAVRFTDKHVGEVIARLEKEGILDQTLVIFATDHGISHARGKQFLYDEGTHVPLVVRGPGIAKGKARDDLVELIDIAPISLAAAGISIPSGMQAKNVFAKDYRPREFVFAARDRCDETTERIRSVRSDRFLYIRNFHPQRPHLQPNAYKDGKSIVQTLRSLHQAGKLDPLAEKLLFSPTRPTEELYEWTTDRWQVKNLASEPAHKAMLEKLRGRLDRWMVETKDRGPESDKMYDSDMAVYVGGRANKKGETVTEKNIAVMKRWAAEGK